MTSPSVEVRRHKLSRAVPDIGWYPAHVDDAVVRDRVATDVSALEVRCGRLGGSDARYDAARDALIGFIRNRLLKPQLTLLLFCAEGSYAPRSRVRSHKGMPWEMRREHSIQVTEAERHFGTESMLAALVVVDAANFEALWPLAAAYTSGTFLLRLGSSEAAPSSELLEFLMDSLDGHRHVMINYSKLIASLHATPWLVVRFGGDASDTFINVTCFARSATLDGMFGDLATSSCR